MCESTFALATPKPITESITKYNYIVSHIPPDIASLVRDILIKPDATDPYGNLKTELINHSAKAAEISDRIFEVTPTPVETYAISGASATITEDRLFREIEKLNKRIDSLSFSRSRSPYRYNKHYHRNNRSKSRILPYAGIIAVLVKGVKEDKFVKSVLGRETIPAKSRGDLFFASGVTLPVH
ncbi:transposon Ty3-G Gag-Pol polyprotein [Trichonephila clavipes]|nr:transposon Ty3-G Gag-Pol polyprotein [Trichonephila clavipes]